MANETQLGPRPVIRSGRREATLDREIEFLKSGLGMAANPLPRPRVYARGRGLRAWGWGPTRLNEMMLRRFLIGLGLLVVLSVAACGSRDEIRADRRDEIATPSA